MENESLRDDLSYTPLALRARAAGCEAVARQPSRPANFESENRVLADLGRVLAVSPDKALQHLAAAVMDLCRVESAGISVLGKQDGDRSPMVHWETTAGAITNQGKTSVPRDDCPSALAFASETPILLTKPERDFPELAAVDPPITEALLTAFEVDGMPAGAIWAISHDANHSFDSEDFRLLDDLSHFASAGLQALKRTRTQPVASDHESTERCPRDDLHDFVENASVAMHWVGADGTILWANRAELDMLGYEAAEYIGQNISTFHVDEPVVEDILVRLGRVETIYDYHSRLRRKDGSIRDVVISSNVLRRGGGYVHTCFTRDVTERKQSDRLDEEQQKMLAMVAAGDPLEECLSALCASLPRLRSGTRASVLLADDQRLWFRDSVAPDIDSTFGAGLKDAPIDQLVIGTCSESVLSGRSVASTDIANDERWSRQWRELCLACGIRACQFEPVRNAEGHCVASFMLCFDEPRSPGDWEGRLAEFGAQVASIALERDRSTRALRESEERYRRLFESVPVGAFVCDHSGIVRDYNSRAAELWGREPKRGDPDERYCGSQNLYLPDGTHLPHEQSPMVQVLQGRGSVHNVEVSVERPDGSRIPVIANFSPLEDPGEIVGTVTTFDDITERKQTEDALRDSEARLWELNRSLEQRVGERTEELRHQTRRLQQLAAELTTAEYRERKRLASMLHDDLQQMLVAARMQLQQLSRIEDGTSAGAIATTEQLLQEAISKSRNLTRELRPSTLYEDGLVSALKALASEIDQRYHIQVRVEASERIPTLDDDLKALLFDCSRELLFNTAKHAGVDQANVDVCYQDGRVQLAIQDHGCGFDPAAVEEVGVHTAGFGLFSIRERLTALGGRVEIDSAPGAGVRVVLEAPAAADCEVIAPSQGQSAASAGDHEGDTMTRLLVVDDHAMVRQGIARVLSEHEWLTVIAEAGDGAEALEMIEQQQPDLVLMDAQMPGMSGIEATREISRRWPGVVTVGFSVQDDELTARSMRQAGAVGFVPKSGDTGEIIRTILGLVDPGRSQCAQDEWFST